MQAQGPSQIPPNKKNSERNREREKRERESERERERGGEGRKLQLGLCRIRLSPQRRWEGFRAAGFEEKERNEEFISRVVFRPTTDGLDINLIPT